MSAVKKKYDYVFYIGFATEETLNHLYESNMKFNSKNELLENGINLLTTLPTIQNYSMISDNSEIEKVYSSRTLKKLLKDYFLNADDIQDGTIDSMDILDIFLENCIIIKENKIDGKCKIVPELSICETYDEVVTFYVIENFINNSDKNISEIKTSEFFDTIKKCMTKFNKGILSTSQEMIDVEVIDDKLVLFGGDEKKNKKFNKHLVSRIIQGLGVILSVETTSKHKENVIKELYSFNFNSDNHVEHISAYDLRERLTASFAYVFEDNVDESVDVETFEKSIGNMEYTIYCDINGNKTGKILDINC